MKKSYKDAPIWKRIVAYVIDLCIYAPIAFIFILFSRLYAYEGDARKGIFMMVCLLTVSVMLFSYIPKKWNGQTIGKKILGIKIESTSDTTEMSYWRYFLREYFAKISVGFLVILMTIMYFIFVSVGNRKITKTFMLDQLFSIRVVEVR